MPLERAGGKKALLVSLPQFLRDLKAMQPAWPKACRYHGASISYLSVCMTRDCYCCQCADVHDVWMWTLTDIPMSEDGKQGRETAKSTCHVAEPLSAVTDPIELAALGALSPQPWRFDQEGTQPQQAFEEKTKEGRISAFLITRTPDPTLTPALAITLPLVLVFEHFLSLCLYLSLFFAFSPSVASSLSLSISRSRSMTLARYRSLLKHHSYEIAAWIVASHLVWDSHMNCGITSRCFPL